MFDSLLSAVGRLLKYNTWPALMLTNAMFLHSLYVGDAITVTLNR